MSTRRASTSCAMLPSIMRTKRKHVHHVEDSTAELEVLNRSTWLACEESQLLSLAGSDTPSIAAGDLSDYASAARLLFGTS